MKEDQESHPSIKRRSFLVRPRLLILLLFLGALIPPALSGWEYLYTNFLERNAPLIRPAEPFKGIGLAPVTFRVKLQDLEAGLDEVVVRTVQRRGTKELLRRELKGAYDADVSVEFPGQRSDLEEGTVVIEVLAFDRSYWSNKGVERFQFKVDFRKPSLEVLTAQHNIVEGGSQLILYKAYDENMAVSGVKVGGNTSYGYRAEYLDPDFKDHRSLHAAVFALELRKPGANPNVPNLGVFAEDEVGNAASLPFYHSITRRTPNSISINLRESFLREAIIPLADAHLFARSQKPPEFNSPQGGIERLLEKFRFVNEDLRSMSEDQLRGLLKTERFDKYWTRPFSKSLGGISSAYGSFLHYYFEKNLIGKHLQLGYELAASVRDRGVVSANDGIVAFSENVGLYGRVLGIDHGFGVYTIYGHLDSVDVQVGDRVTAAQVIGTVGKTGFARETGVLFEVRVHGIPVDAREWWDRGWFQGHIIDKLRSVKEGLGIATGRQF